VDLPDRRTYDAVLETQDILVDEGAANVGTAEVEAAIERASEEVGANPLQVATFIAGKHTRKIRQRGDIDAAAIGDRVLTMADVDRGVVAARRDLHDTAVSQNELNAAALAVVNAMSEISVPRSVDGSGPPLLDHVNRAIRRVFGFDESVDPRDSAADGVLRRVADFFRAVARPHLRPGDEPWSKYLDQNFTIADKDERQLQVNQWVIKPARELIEQRIGEIDAIISETAGPQRRSVSTLLRALGARARPGGSGTGPLAL
jgi:hypothetical protein